MEHASRVGLREALNGSRAPAVLVVTAGVLAAASTDNNDNTVKMLRTNCMQSGAFGNPYLAGLMSKCGSCTASPVLVTECFTGTLRPPLIYAL